MDEANVFAKLRFSRPSVALLLGEVLWRELMRKTVCRAGEKTEQK